MYLSITMSTTILFLNYFFSQLSRLFEHFLKQVNLDERLARRNRVNSSPMRRWFCEKPGHFCQLS